jgi:hypothetical protein
LQILAQDASFTRQSVNMKIDKGHLLISGMYFVSGPAEESSSISFPFPFGVNYGEIDSLHIYDVVKSDFITFDKKVRKSVTFTLDFDNKGKSMIQIYYRLKLLGNKAEYPFREDEVDFAKLDKACFYLIAPTEMNVRNFTYLPKDTIDAGLNVVYYWEMHDFKPEQNFEFRFATTQ